MVQTKDRRTHLDRRASPLPPYSMHLVWDPDDEIFVVTVPELPGCMTHGKTYIKAVKRGQEAIASWLAAAEHWGTPIPPPDVVRYALDDQSTAVQALAEALARGVGAADPAHGPGDPRADSLFAAIAAHLAGRGPGRAPEGRGEA